MADIEFLKGLRRDDPVEVMYGNDQISASFVGWESSNPVKDSTYLMGGLTISPIAPTVLAVVRLADDTEVRVQRDQVRPPSTS